jgi:cell division septal protein FtsQ
LRFKLACALLALLVSYGLWLALLRNLPLFQVESVTITGLSGARSPQITSTLALTAREMTTTDFSLARLRSAVAGYESVEGLEADTEFPHGVHIEVRERRALARLDYGGTIVAVSGNDRVLEGIVASRNLPLVRSASAPTGDRVSDPLTRAELALLAAAPQPLLDRVYAIRIGSEGLTVRLRGGPLIYFGDDALPHAKWDSAAVVLASPTARGARYIDVSLPGRPAADVGNPATSSPASTAQSQNPAAALVGAGSAATSSSTSG